MIKAVTGFVWLATLLMGNLTLQAAFYIAPTDPNKQKKISDAHYRFKLGDFNCGVEPTNFMRMPDDTISQARSLYCILQDGTQVSVFLNCELPTYTMTTLTIKRNGVEFIPTLICGPDR